VQRSYGWKSRYVPEYSAIGEAPEEICESFDTHYANSRGYFQTFWSANCPLLNRDLGLFYRLMYASQCFQHFASGAHPSRHPGQPACTLCPCRGIAAMSCMCGDSSARVATGVWTLVFTLVPIVHLIFGYFPVNFTVHVVVTMIAHYALRMVMLLYCDSLKQMRALWFARIATSINWWPDFKAAFFIPLKAAIGPNASFRSRAWTDSAPTRNLKALTWPILFIILSIIAFIGGCVHLRTLINLPTVLSLCLVVVNFVPPFLLVMLWNFGQGPVLTRIAGTFMFLSLGASIAALIFLALLYPREVDYDRAATLSLAFLNAERAGDLPSGFPIQWRFDSGLQYQKVSTTWFNATTNTNTTQATNLSGGFYNEGDVGPVKVTWNIALTTTMLAWSMLEYPEYWAANIDRKNLAISVLRHGAEYSRNVYQITPLREESDLSKPLHPRYDILYYVVRPRALAGGLRQRARCLAISVQRCSTSHMRFCTPDAGGQLRDGAQGVAPAGGCANSGVCGLRGSAVVAGGPWRAGHRGHHLLRARAA
jgi:endoglucanase